VLKAQNRRIGPPLFVHFGIITALIEAQPRDVKKGNCIAIPDLQTETSTHHYADGEIRSWTLSPYVRYGSTRRE